VDAGGLAGSGPAAGLSCAVLAARRGRAIGALLVPDALAGGVAIAGVPAGPGLHALRHADRVDLAGHPFWISADTEPVECGYDPTRHGEDQRCLRTKTRLVAGEAIVVCPGTPAAACGGLFKRAAWRPTLRCHQCGHDPTARRWQPPRRGPGARLAELLALAKRGGDASR
jgi:hypothetical protein